MITNNFSNRSKLIMGVWSLLACIGSVFLLGCDEHKVRFSIRVGWEEPSEVSSVTGWYIVDTEKAMKLTNPWELERELGEADFRLDKPGDVTIPSVASPFSDAPRVLPTAALFRIEWNDKTASILRKNLMNLGLENNLVELDMKNTKYRTSEIASDKSQSDLSDDR